MDLYEEAQNFAKNNNFNLHIEIEPATRADKADQANFDEII